jgi:hypothetical protein
MPSSNGADPRPLRFVIFGESIVSDFDNPPAATWRPILQALATAGHDAVFLEQRRNRAMVELLQARGAAPLRAFADQYPEIHYRTYDLPSGAERSVWFGREVATADVVIALDTAPQAIFEELATYDTPRIVKILHPTGHGQTTAVPDTFDIVLDPSWPDSTANPDPPATATQGLLETIRQIRHRRLGTP